MRTFRLAITAQCNQNCGFCARPAGVPSTEDDALARVREASEQGARVLLLTGGEPTLHAGLARLIHASREMGIERIEIETNGLRFAYAAYAAGLRKAGLDAAHVLYPAADATAWEAFTRTRGSSNLAHDGIRNAAAAGIEVSLRVPVTEATLPYLTAIIDSAREALPTGVMDLCVYGPDGDTAGLFAANEEAIYSAYTIAARNGITLRFSPQASPPPCLFTQPERMAAMFAIGGSAAADGEEYAKPSACALCYLQKVCPGVHGAFDGFSLGPIRSVAQRDAFGVHASGRDWEVENFFSCMQTRDEDGRMLVHEALLRINNRCNQKCAFCLVEDSDTAEAPRERVTRAIREIAERGAKRLTFSGGEPTLSRDLEAYIRLAKECGIGTVCVQTNAVLLADAAKCGKLREAGMDEAFVSLHGPTAEISDAITGAPGTFAKTVQGIRNLLDAGTVVTVNFVICRVNAAHLADYVRFVHDELKGAGVSFNLATPFYGKLMHMSIVPRYAEIREGLAAAIENCIALGLHVGNVSVMCGVPACILDGDRRLLGDLLPVATEPSNSDFIKPERCAGCSLDRYCYGVRRYYVELYGDEEIHPV